MGETPIPQVPWQRETWLENLTDRYVRSALSLEDFEWWVERALARGYLDRPVPLAEAMDPDGFRAFQDFHIFRAPRPLPITIEQAEAMEVQQMRDVGLLDVEFTALRGGISFTEPS